MTTDSTAETSPQRDKRPLSRIALFAGSILLAAATAYLLVVGVLWFLHVSTVQSTVDDLEASLKSATSDLDDTAAQLDSSRADLDEVLESIVELADDKAAARDSQLLLLDLGTYMAECATETGELVKVVHNRYLYVGWTVIRAENQLKSYCAELSAAFQDLLDEMED